MLVRSRRMNKKLIASLLALGLILSPVTGTISETYAAKAFADENLKDDSESIEKIKNYRKYYEANKNDNDFRLADDKLKIQIETTILEAIEYADSANTSSDVLDKYIKSIEESLTNLAINGKENQKNLKINILASRKLLENNLTKKDSEEFKKLEAKIGQAVEILRKENLGKASFEDLKIANNELIDSFLKAKESFGDKTEYIVPDDKQISNFDEELNNKQNGDSSFEKILEHRKNLLEKDETFRLTETYINADSNKREAYEKAISELKDLSDLSESDENSKLLSEKLNSAKQSKENIAGKDDSPEVSGEDQNKQAIENEKDKLKSYVNDVANINAIIAKESFKNKALGEEYNKELKEAMKLAMSEDSSIELKTYQDAVSKLKDLTDKIKSEDKNPTETEEIPAPIKGEKKFENKDAAKKGLEDLINRTEGIAIDDFYGTDQKNAKESYIKNRDEAIKAKDNKDASLDDLTKAYESFNKSITELSKFLIDRLQKLVDEDKDFRESDKFKKANENVVTSYDELIKKAKEEIAKTEADANDLNKLYRDLNIAKQAIEENLSEQARRLKSAISESESFKNKYKDFGNGLEGPQKTAKKRYEELINKAKELDKAGKLDSDEAKTTLELIENTKAFIEGKISEKKYLSNKYYHILKELKNQKGYEEKVNQAARDRIDEALKLYEKGEKDEETIYSALDAALKEDSVKEFINEINKSKDPNKTRDELLAKLRTLAEEEENFKAGEKYKNAPKELKADYDKALEEAKNIIEKENPTEAEIKDAYEKLKDAVNKIEIRHIIDRRLVVLADKFKENQLKIKNPADRKAIADKINALKNNPYTTMEEVENVEAELDKLIKTQQAVTTTTVAPQSQAPAGQVPTTTRPISTVTNPGSIVKTGINGIAKVAAVLAVAAIILKLTSKKGEKDETNK